VVLSGTTCSSSTASFAGTAPARSRTASCFAASTVKLPLTCPELQDRLADLWLRRDYVHGVALRREMFLDILRVGALASFSPLQTVLTVLILTRLVAGFIEALDGHGDGPLQVWVRQLGPGPRFGNSGRGFDNDHADDFGGSL
jgi:hypothetical protein